MSSLFASLDMKLASTWKSQGVSGEGILNPVLNIFRDLTTVYTNKNWFEIFLSRVYFGD